MSILNHTRPCCDSIYVRFWDVSLPLECFVVLGCLVSLSGLTAWSLILECPVFQDWVTLLFHNALLDRGLNCSTRLSRFTGMSCSTRFSSFT